MPECYRLDGFTCGGVIHINIFLRCADVLVSEQLLHQIDVAAFFIDSLHKGFPQ